MKKSVIFLLVAFMLTACSSTNRLTLSVVEPAEVTVHPSIKKVGIINRSTPSEKNNILNKIDEVISAETKNLDSNGATNCMLGVQNELLKNNRFEEIKVLSHLKLTNPGVGVMPSPISQEEVLKICRANEVDLLFVLENYDTTSDISYTTNAAGNIATPFGNIPTTEHIATLRTEIKTGWRIYDPMASTIIDEYILSDFLTTTGRGLTPMVAASALIERNEAVKQLSNKIGQNYALRIVPYSIRVSRDYFVRGSSNFKIAKRKAQTGNWNGAAEHWQQETTNPKPKIAGRACYNMAIINEINGNLNLAIDWAQKSYENYNIRNALHYLNILKDRRYRNSILEEQQKSQ